MWTDDDHGQERKKLCLPVRTLLLGDKELLDANGRFFTLDGGLMNSAGGTM